jgi:hypothetical protein
MNTIELFESLYNNNKYLVKIYNKINREWTIYIYKNQHIQIDINYPIILNQKINIEEMIKYIEDDSNKELNISYVVYYDDNNEYKENMKDIFEKIKNYYLEYNKIINIKCKMY